ncbi:MAG TPA: TonB-dependent receptor [Cytophagaceae bacterium]|jgi:Fe(3+) dicitrate transport protein|nr:TonB-dependent receptor [Cytophagaceae bacterium]
MRQFYRPGIFFLLLSIFSPNIFAQSSTGNLKGVIKDSIGHGISHATILLKNTTYGAAADSNGHYIIKNIPAGKYTVEFSFLGYNTILREVFIKSAETTDVSPSLSFEITTVPEITIIGIESKNGMAHLNDVSGTVIYSGKKTEVLVIDSLDANTAQNNTRQILGRVPGMNFSETEGAGFPSNGIGSRGLNPTQSIEMNVRQNGYNITSDIYGYNEAYYVPAMDGVQRIELVRGASSLQFGPQFGGTVNYIMKGAPKNKPFEFNTQQTAGSYGLFTSSNSIGGTYKKFSYYAFGQYKTIQGWRPNSDFHSFTGFSKIEYRPTDKLKFGLEYSVLRNYIHMPGGLTDEEFNADSRQSVRARNWLNSPWNILTGTIDYKISDKTSFSLKSAFLSSGRNLVWRNEDGGAAALDTIDRSTGTYIKREVEKEKFTSSTNELRLRTNYRMFGLESTFATGLRFFYGKLKRQGGGPGSTGTDFDLNLYGGDYEYSINFTTTNAAYFFENIFRVTDKFSITPGFRFEYIRSTANGYKTFDTVRVNIDKSRNRYIPLLGLGSQYKLTSTTTIYGNISQAYRPMDYSSLTPIGVTSKIDPNLKDAYGYNSDLGWRGTIKEFLNFDISLFCLRYNRRIGLVSLTDINGNPYTLRTNVANSVHKGLEAYVEINPVKMLFGKSKIGNISLFNSFAYIDARYVSSNSNLVSENGDTIHIKGKHVEYAPNIINRTGVTYSLKGFSATYTLSYTGKSYGDANNTVHSTNPVIGVIPSYTVMDLSASYKIRSYTIKAGVNNLADKRYFTKRTDEYPGPGIIPSIARSFYISVGAKF